MLGSLKKTIENDNDKPLKFFDLHPDLYQILELMIITTRGLLMQTVEHLPEDENSTYRYMLWRTLYDYTEQALLLIIKSRIDEGYALLRMASELSRDIARIAESQDNFNMWKDKSNKHWREEYKNIFKFDKEDTTEKHVYKLYNLTSIYGVHGHQTRDSHLSHLGVVVNDRFIKVNVSDSAVLNALAPWILAFFPMHLMAAKTFQGVYSAITPNPFAFFLKTQLDLLPILEDVQKNIKRNYPK